MSRVLLVGKGAPDRGGIPTFLSWLCAGEVGRRHEVTFLNLAHTGTPEGGAVTAGNVKRTLHDAWRVWRCARGQDVVHVNSAGVPAVTVLRAGLLAAAGRVRGCGVVLHVHGGNLGAWLDTRPRRALMRLGLAPAHRVVAVWRSGHDALQAVVGPSRLRLVPNGIDTTLFRPMDRTSGVPRVLYVGLLTPRKGVLDLLRASRMLHEEGMEHELALLGGTPDEGPAAARPVLEAAEGRAVLLGTRPPEQMAEAYAAADVFCLPSWWEAMPMSVLEAMASGLPVVATDVGDVPEMVADGHAGFVVPVKSPEEVAAALRKLLQDPERRRVMGAAARDRVERRYSAESAARAVCAVLDEATSARRRG